MDGFAEPISPPAPDVLDDYDLDRLSEIESMLGELDSDFKKRDLNTVCMKTAEALQPRATQENRQQFLGQYVFPVEHARLQPPRPKPNVQQAEPAQHVNNNQQQHALTGSIDDSIRKIIQATVYQTVEQLHETGLLVCAKCLSTPHYGRV